MMFALSDAVSAIIVAAVTGVPAILAAWWSRSNFQKLKPNGGLSPVDAINRIDQQTAGLIISLTRLHDRLVNIEDRQASSEGRLAVMEAHLVTRGEK